MTLTQHTVIIGSLATIGFLLLHHFNKHKEIESKLERLFQKSDATKTMSVIGNSHEGIIIAIMFFLLGVLIV